MNKKRGICHICGSPNYVSKTDMCKEILIKVGYDPKKLNYSYVNLDTQEVRAIWLYLCKGGQK